jgi:acetoin:2,6-dichlorophenolindophenol oxidoreductase subunit alpha
LSSSTPAVASESGGLPSDAEQAYMEVLRIRLFEEAAQRLFMQNEIEGSIHLYDGQEAVAVGVCLELRPDDMVAATYRGHGVCLARGSSIEGLFAELLGRTTGTCGGRAGSMNVVDLKHGVIGCFAIVGGSLAAASGAALGMQLQQRRDVAVAFFGDGAVNQAYFHECLNFAAIRHLPVVYVCENNQYGEFTPWSSVTAGGSILQRASAYGMPACEVDGNDVFAVREATRNAVERARTGKGPTLLVCETYRHKGHSRHDDPRRYRPQTEADSWLARDPLVLLERSIDDLTKTRIRNEVATQIAAALELARTGPLPDPQNPASATKEALWPS